MSRVALALALLAAPGLLFAAITGGSDLVPAFTAPIVVAVGVLVAAVGAWRRRTRVHAAGVALGVLGVSLTGVGLSPLVLAVAVASTALLVASLNLHLVLPAEGGASTILTALLAAAGVAGLALILARLARWLGGGGVDAAAGVTGWLVLVAAVTWGLLRWAREAEPR